MTDKPINKEERDNYLISYLWKRKTSIDFLVISQNILVVGRGALGTTVLVHSSLVPFLHLLLLLLSLRMTTMKMVLMILAHFLSANGLWTLLITKKSLSHLIQQKYKLV